jgi:hypothetical protein
MYLPEEQKKTGDMDLESSRATASKNLAIKFLNAGV